MMMHIGHVGMAMLQAPMAMCVRMGFAWWISGPMLMLVMRIVDVRMCVFHWFVNVFVLVMLGQV